MLRRMLIISAAAVLLTSCGTGASLQKGKYFFAEAQEKGREVGNETLDRMADALDGYCQNVPTSVRSFLRTEVNSRTVHYDASDFCVPKGQ